MTMPASRSRTVARTLVVTIACAAGIACGTARRGEPLAPPLALDARAERGRAIFMASCHSCHPGGEAGLGPALNDKPLPEFLKKFQVRHGLGAMPSFPEEEISDEQLDELMEYLKALRRSTPKSHPLTRADGRTRARRAAFGPSEAKGDPS